MQLRWRLCVWLIISFVNIWLALRFDVTLFGMKVKCLTCLKCVLSHHVCNKFKSHHSYGKLCVWLSISFISQVIVMTCNKLMWLRLVWNLWQKLSLFRSGGSLGIHRWNPCDGSTGSARSEHWKLCHKFQTNLSHINLLHVITMDCRIRLMESQTHNLP